MSKTTPRSYCPTCDTTPPANVFSTLDGDPRPRCSVCDGLLIHPATAFVSPSSVAIFAKLTGFVARSLIAHGVLSALAARASHSDTDPSGAAFHVALVLLKEAARL